MENKSHQPGEQKDQPATRKAEEAGDKAFMGSTTTNPDKHNLQTVASNDLDEPGNSSKGVPASSNMNDNRTGIPSDENDEVDTGYIRSAAFSQDKEPKNENGDDWDEDLRRQKENSF